MMTREPLYLLVDNRLRPCKVLSVHMIKEAAIIAAENLEKDEIPTFVVVIDGVVADELCSLLKSASKS